MYVCICNALTERQVDAAIAAGAVKPSTVFRLLGSQPQCAKCLAEMRERLREARRSGGMEAGGAGADLREAAGCVAPR